MLDYESTRSIKPLLLLPFHFPSLGPFPLFLLQAGFLINLPLLLVIWPCSSPTLWYLATLCLSIDRIVCPWSILLPISNL